MNGFRVFADEHATSQNSIIYAKERTFMSHKKIVLERVTCTEVQPMGNVSSGERCHLRFGTNQSQPHIMPTATRAPSSPPSTHRSNDVISRTNRVVIIMALVITFALACQRQIHAHASSNPHHGDGSASRPDYDHQNVTYESPFPPMRVTTQISMQPFFSPDTSVPTELEVIQDAKHRIDISIPSWSSWNGCSFPNKDGCTGCKAAFLRANETFPVWRALVNAMGRGVRVRILSNKFPEPPCEGMMTPLTYLHVAGADVRFYTSTTFSHSKYICADDNRAAISSINFSKTSQILNREAGLVISNDRSGKIVSFVQSVFEYDFVRGAKHDPHRDSFPKEDRRICQDKTPIDIIPPNYPEYNCDVSSGKSYKINDVMDVEIIVSPDHAYDSIMPALRNAKKSLELSIYQITDETFCDAMIELHGRGVALKLFVSNKIYGNNDAKRAKMCYQRLFEHGITVRLSHPRCLTYSHQKYWIIDGNDIYVSTGNWSPTDYPMAPFIFPAWPNPKWRVANRDYTVHISGNRALVDRFLQTFDSDFDQGVDFNPNYYCRGKNTCL